MPQPRKYLNRAAQQAAYRQRQDASRQTLLAQKGLPPLPAIPTMPGTVRWSAMIEQAQFLLREASDQMQAYHDARSEQWQQGDRAEELLTRLEHLLDAITQLQEVEWAQGLKTNLRVRK